MPAGDPAGYLPKVIRSRIKKAGAKPYKTRSKQPKIPARGFLRKKEDA